MNFLSTAGHTPPTDLATALASGLAPDGGLYVPERLPAADPAALAGTADLPDLAAELLVPFFAGSPLAGDLPEICREALDLPLPVVNVEPGRTWILELFHGPTAAFKDFAARFLAACLARLPAPESGLRTVLVATSGDTGAAVADAFHRRPGFRVVVLYPEGRVSPAQAHHLGSFGDNITACRVDGSFDTCQHLAKQALNDPDLARRHGLTSANSISLGRLLPQITYYARAALDLDADIDDPVNLVVPTGNLGNALAGVLAREMGLPIGEIHLATNANRTLPEFFSGQDYRGRAGRATLANAMDVGDPSNFERLDWFFRDRDLRDAGLYADSVDDGAIREAIRRAETRWGRVLCPHTACAAEVCHRIRENGDDRRWLLAATAHPAKFAETVAPLVEGSVTPPPALAAMLEQASRSVTLRPDLATLDALLGNL